MKHIPDVNYNQIIYIIGINVISAHRKLGIEWNIQECDLLWIGAVGIVNNMDAFVLIVLKDIIAPGIDLSRLSVIRTPEMEMFSFSTGCIYTGTQALDPSTRLSLGVQPVRHTESPMPAAISNGSFMSLI